jgi:RNA recognition motif-containing protein
MRIFVGNLNWATTEDELGRLFEPCDHSAP